MVRANGMLIAAPRVRTILKCPASEVETAAAMTRVKNTRKKLKREQSKFSMKARSSLMDQLSRIGLDFGAYSMRPLLDQLVELHRDYTNLYTAIRAV